MLPDLSGVESAVRAAAREALTTQGERQAASRLGVSRATIVKLAHGVAVSEGTLLSVGARLGLIQAA